LALLMACISKNVFSSCLKLGMMEVS
jgi:hypothetical protein